MVILNSRSSLLSSSQSSSSTPHKTASPKLLSFQPPSESLNENSINATNIIFNYHEPLSANLETNYENDIVMRSDRLSIYEDLKSDKFKNDTYRNNMDSCNDSLAKLVNLISNKQPSNFDKSCGIYDLPNDSSMVSASIDGTNEVNLTYPSNNQSKLNNFEDLYSNKKLKHEKFILHNPPPHGFRDSFEGSNKNNLITNLNIVKINKNEHSKNSNTKYFKMSSESSSTSSTQVLNSYSDASLRINPVQSEFFLNETNRV